MQHLGLNTFGIGTKLTQIAFLVLLSTTVVVCWVSAMELDKVHRGRESEKNMQTIGKKNRNPNSDNKTLVVIGASYTRGWNIREIAGLKVVNKGVNGNQSFEMLARFQEDVIAVRPRAVIIWGFINDIFGSKREEVNDALEKVRGHYKKMAAMSQDNGIIPIIATEITTRPIDSWKMTLRGWAGWVLGQESYQTYVNRHVMAVNQWIKEYARKNGLLLLDFQPVLSDTKGVRKKEFATRDGSHISPQGYEALTLYTKNRLEKALK